VREQVAALDPLLPVKPVERVGALFEADAAPRRLTLSLLGAFALVAVVLAVIGVYGVIAYGVSQRTGEFGVRLALGAGAERLQAMVLKQGLTLVAAGIVFGVVGALVSARLAGALLFGVGNADPASYAAAALVFLIVASVACLLPARRAARTNPTEALRYE
jgi:putative ABC transport system permease protein